MQLPICVVLLNGSTALGENGATSGADTAKHNAPGFYLQLVSCTQQVASVEAVAAGKEILQQCLVPFVVAGFREVPRLEKSHEKSISCIFRCLLKWLNG